MEFKAQGKVKRILPDRSKVLLSRRLQARHVTNNGIHTLQSLRQWRGRFISDKRLSEACAKVSPPYETIGYAQMMAVTSMGEGIWYPTHHTPSGD